MNDYKNRRTQLVGIGWVDSIPACQVKPGMKLSRDGKPTCDVISVRPHGTQVILALQSPAGALEDVPYRGKTLVAAYWPSNGQPIL